MENSEKILFVIDNLGSGGAQNQLTLLATNLKKRGYDISVFTYYKGDFFAQRLISCGVPIINIPKKNRFGFKIIFSLLQLIKREGFTKIISFLDTPNFYAAICKMWFSDNITLVISYRSNTIFEKLSPLALLIKRWYNNQADYIVSNSYHEKNTWLNRFPSLNEKWKTIYNCIDYDTFYPDLNTARENHFLVVGSIGPLKNGILVIEALNHLKSQGVQINIVWIGKKVIEIKERKEYLTQMLDLLEKYDLNNQWTWKDPIPDIRTAYLNCKGLILASIVEGLPNVVCEALATGTPCIVSDILDHSKLINHNKNGLLFQTNNREALADSILRLKNLSDFEYNQWAKNASLHAKKLFNEENFTQKFIALLNI